MNINIEKQTSLIFFYILYFAWLTTLTFLNLNSEYLNYFTAAISLFYLLFLKEPGDFILFVFAGSLLILGSITSFVSWDIQIRTEEVKNIPYWLPLAWGTTVVALRKFYIIMKNR